MKLLLSILGLIALLGTKDGDEFQYAQLISYRVLDNGDTINRMYDDSVKSGKWFEDYKIDRSYFYQVGHYYLGLKEGEWKVYNDLDQLVEIANYFHGAKNGRNILFHDGKVIAIGQQVGVFFTQEKDTVLVTDPEDFQQYATEIENTAYHLRNGKWYFMNPYTRDTTQMIEYNYGHIVQDIDLSQEADAYRDSIIESRMPHNDPGYKPIKKRPRKYYFPK